jgi:hypothetical protein
VLRCQQPTTTENLFEGFKGHVTWFTGHMEKASRHMKEKLKDVDVVVEVRDARVSVSCRKFFYFNWQIRVVLFRIHRFHYAQ